MTPYEYWRTTHAYHHSHSGDLDFRGVGDIITLTVEEYKALPKRRKFFYRMYRNPLILFVIGPALHFMLKHRMPLDIPKKWRRVWKGIWATNAVILAIFLIGGFTMGFGKFLALQLPVTAFASSIGVWLFYVQHQYEDCYWHWHTEWDYYDAALQGSSHLVLPKPLQWLTASIGLHHVHHLNAMIPNYRLQECMESSEELQKAVKIRMSETFRLMGLALVDDKKRKMITFREYRSSYKHA
jgi:omega-6 fatty acid desaturase (delta-12 desaturase)